jgi:hypothetical protein
MFHLLSPYCKSPFHIFFFFLLPKKVQDSIKKMENERVKNLHVGLCEILEEKYKQNVNDLANSKYRWRKYGNACECFAKILIGAGIIITYCESYFNTRYLALVGGALGTIGIVMREFSQYASNESKERTMLLKVSLTEGFHLVSEFLTDPFKMKVPTHEERVSAESFGVEMKATPIKQISS